jgi:lipoprotein-anchoring transpeptidase ErfK/SrfK
VKRAGLALLFLLGLAAAGGVSAGVVSTTTTATTGTTTVPEALIASGVTIGGVAVGGMTGDEATRTVKTAFADPLRLLVLRHRLLVGPARLGAVAQVKPAVARALTVPPGTAVKLRVKVNRPLTQRYIAGIARRFDRKPVDARLFLRNLRPWISKQKPGWALRREQALARIFGALVANSRDPVRLRVRGLRPSVTRSSIGPVIVIHRGSNRLYLYNGVRQWRIFGVATGQSAYPTPVGRWTIVVKWRNPWWYPPKSSWARGAKPIPPGPGNPLGTRWMGLSVENVGIHGTPDAASIGYSASHGCIRMRIPDAEWLFNHVKVGTPVFIVAS